MESDNTDWELEEGLPQFEDPFIQQYLKGRDALIAEEQKRRHGERTAERHVHKS
jgi:adenosine deaminase CECR1